VRSIGSDNRNDDDDAEDVHGIGDEINDELPG
jgi:hypothetical protein